MSLLTAIRAALGKIEVGLADEARLRKEVEELRRRLDGFEAKRDALAVPPGSTLFQNVDVRMFRITANSASGTATAIGRIQTIDGTGNLIDDTDDTTNYSIRKPNPQISLQAEDKVGATFEGLTSANVPVYVLIGSGALVLRWARVVSVNLNSITATPVQNSAGTPITPTPANVAITGHNPTGRTPVLITGTPVIPYISDGTSHVAINIPEVPAGGGLGHCLQPGGGPGALVWDYVRIGTG